MLLKTACLRFLVVASCLGSAVVGAAPANDEGPGSTLPQDAVDLPARMTPVLAPHRHPTPPDNSLAVSDSFDSGGGTLTATAADGTKFVLTIPADAFVLPVRITMTPVSSVGQVPLRGPVAAVAIEPEGFFLWETADLKILPPTPPALKTLTYFRYGGPDGSLTPYPGVLGSTDIEMPISYLATYGATSGEISALSSRGGTHVETVRPLSATTALSASLAPYVARAAALYKQHLLGELDYESYVKDSYAIWDEAWTEVVLPALLGLGSDCDPEAIAAALEMAFELLHLDPETDPNYKNYNDNIDGIVKQQVLGCIDLAYQRCKNNNDPSEVKLMLDLDRVLERAALISDSEQEDIAAKVSKCLTFELDFESALTVSYASLTERLKVRAIVPVHRENVYLTPTKVLELLRGTAPIQHELASVQGPGCTFSVATKPGAFNVDRINLQLFYKAGEGGRVPRDDIRLDMIYLPGDPQEQLTQSCQVEGGPLVTSTGPFGPVFAPFYALLHDDEVLQQGEYEVWARPPWEPIRSGNILAKAQYVRTVSLQGVSTSEETYIFFKHTPQ